MTLLSLYNWVSIISSSLLLDFILSCGFVGFEIRLLRSELPNVHRSTDLPGTVLLMYIAQVMCIDCPLWENEVSWLVWYCLLNFQSVTVPLQGFLNAIVYGWTREDFIQVIRPQHDVTQSQHDRLFRGQSKASATNSGTPQPYQPKAAGGRDDVTQRTHLVEHDMLFSVESEQEH